MMTATGDEPAWVGEVIRFWLEETPPEARFRRSDALDEAIRERFGTLCATLEVAPPPPDRLTPRLALASVIVLDQFSRNMNRGSPQAFASDPAARAIAAAAVDAGLDASLSIDGRAFLYLPFEHSEDLADQDRSVRLFTALGNAEYTRFAVAHRDIIARFGRFPHRNDVLGRTSTAEEIGFLQQPGSSF